MKTPHLMIAAAGVAAAFASPPAVAADDFFAGKTMTLIVGFGPGGGYDAYTRLMSRHIGNRIPGRPNIIVQNMPGAGSSQAAAYIFGPARQDGTELGVFNSQTALNEALGEKTPYKVTEFTYIGRLVRSLNLALVSDESPGKSLADAKEVEIIFAASGPNSATTRIPMAFNRMMGTRFKVLRGYDSSAKMLHALEKGEVHGIGGTSLTAIRTQLKHWLDADRIQFLWVTALDRHPDLPDVPAAAELAETEEQRKIMEIITSSSSFGYALWGPPKLPRDRLQVLRTAFNETVKDPAFVADANKQNLDLEPETETGEYLEQVMRVIAEAPTGAA